MPNQKERPVEYSKLIEHFDDVGGLRVSSPLTTRGGDQYRVVRISSRSAAVIVEGADDLEITLTSDGGDISTIEKGVVDTIVGYGKQALKLGLQLVSGECSLQNKQTATFDPKTGNMTGFTNTTTVVCPAS